jgi:hypothetical protein
MDSAQAIGGRFVKQLGESCGASATKVIVLGFRQTPPGSSQTPHQATSRGPDCAYHKAAELASGYACRGRCRSRLIGVCVTGMAIALCYTMQLRFLYMMIADCFLPGTVTAMLWSEPCNRSNSSNNLSVLNLLHSHRLKVLRVVHVQA